MATALALDPDHQADAAAAIASERALRVAAARAALEAEPADPAAIVTTRSSGEPSDSRDVTMTPPMAP